MYNPYYINIDVSGKSYKKINTDGTLIPLNNYDYAINIVTSQDPVHYQEEDNLCYDINSEYPYPNPSNDEILIPNSDAFCSSIQSLSNILLFGL